MSSDEPMLGTVGRTGVQEVRPDVPYSSLAVARELVETSGRRLDPPLRKSFVRVDDDAIKPPLAVLIDRRGRGGAVALKLYLALVWRCGGEPFTTEISARKWALLLGLEDPNTLGARRITAALEVLREARLIRLHKRRGEPTRIELLDESGSGFDYRLPSTAHTRSRSEDKKRHIYFKVPHQLWTDGHIQSMSAAALAMLLVVLAEQRPREEHVWWSTTEFPKRYNLTPTTRSKGTRELVARRLLLVKKQAVPMAAANRVFARERVRNVYLLINEAYPHRVADQPEVADMVKGTKKTLA